MLTFENHLAMKSLKTSFWMVLVLVLWGCGAGKNKTNVELIQDMMEQPSIKAQEYDESMKGGISALLPPENTKPVGFSPYKYALDIDGAARDLKNPFEGKVDAEVLSLGEKMFVTNCQVCHGSQGEGNGHLRKIGKYPLPIPSLLSEKVRKWKDGNIYHVITVGQGSMGAYASHVPQEMRWQLVSYIRQLQAEQGVK
ncbi:MAG: cytochrome c [Bdellovibrio sp.]